MEEYQSHFLRNQNLFTCVNNAKQLEGILSTMLRITTSQWIDLIDKVQAQEQNLCKQVSLEYTVGNWVVKKLCPK